MRMRSLLIGALLMGLCHFAVADHFLFLTGNSGQIRQSTDFGVTWTVFNNTPGAGWRGIAADPVSGTLFAYASGQGTSNARPIRAFNIANGNLLGTVTHNESGTDNQRPMIFFGTNLYVNAGSTNFTIPTAFVGWDGASFSSTTTTPSMASDPNNWRGNDLTIATGASGTNYLFYNGTSGYFFRRRTILGDGLLSTSIVSYTLNGLSGGNLFDMVFTGSGRLLALTSAGLYYSAPGSVETTTINLLPLLTFGSAEDLSAFDPGPNARELVLYGSSLYLFTTSNVYRYSYDDVNNTLTQISTGTHGLNTVSLQALAVVPEPSTAMLVCLAFGVAFYARKRCLT